MALSGTLVADFASFQTAVDKAIVQLQGFEASTSKVETSLNRMVDSFSGRKIITEATLMAKAVEDVGGVSHLTAAELQRVSTVAAEAAEKLKAWGQDVPKNVADLASHAKQATTEFGDLKTAAKEVAAELAAMFAVDKVLAFVGSLTEGARALRNLGVETGIGTTQLQLYGAVTRDMGVTTEQLGRAIFIMSTKVAGNDASMAGALHALGLTFEQFKGQSNEQVFEALLRAIDTVPDQMEKASIASELFNKRTGAALLKVAHNFDELVGAARASNKVLDEDTVKAAAAAADNFERLTINAKNVAATLLGPVFKGANDFVETAEKAGVWNTVLARLLDSLNGDTEAFERLAKAAGKVPKDIELPSDKPKGAATVPSDAAKMRAIEIDQVKALTAAQETYLEKLFDLGKLTKENAAAFGVSVEQMDTFKKKEEEIIQRQQTLDTLRREMSTLQLDVNKKLIDQEDVFIAKMEKRLAGQTAFVASLLAERAAAVTANTERNLGPAQADRGLAAVATRDAALTSIEARQALHPGIDLTPLVQKAWQDFDALVLGLGKSGVGAAAPPITLNVSGVMDLATTRQITDAVSEELLRRSGRKF